MLKPYAGILLDEYTDGEILTDPMKRQALLIKAIYGMDGLDLSGMLEVLSTPNATPPCLKQLLPNCLMTTYLNFMFCKIPKRFTVA